MQTVLKKGGITASERQADGALAICLPVMETNPRTGYCYESRLEWYRLPKDIFEHKVYPLCKCGRRFVPLSKKDKDCFFCIFTKK